MRHWSGLDLKYACRRAAAAERARARTQFLGFTPKGPVWTDKEDAILRGSYPDYGKAIEPFKRRSYRGCRNHVRFLHLVKPRPQWTGAGVTKLRKMFGRAGTDELMQAFPERTWSQIAWKARMLGLTKKRGGPSPTPWQPIDAIKQRARERNYTLLDVDMLADGSISERFRSRWTSILGAGRAGKRFGQGGLRE